MFKDIQDFWDIPEFKNNTVSKIWNQKYCFHRLTNTYEFSKNIEAVTYNNFLYLVSKHWNMKNRNLNYFCNRKYIYIINFKDIKVNLGCKIFYSNAKTIKIHYNSNLKYLIAPNCEKLTITGLSSDTFKIIYTPELKEFTSRKHNIFKPYGLFYAPKLKKSSISLKDIINLTDVKSNDSYAAMINDKIQIYSNIDIDYDYLYKHSRMVEGFNETDIFTIEDLIKFVKDNDETHYSALFNILSDKTENYIKFILIQLFFSNQQNIDEDVENLVYNLSLLQLKNLIVNTILITQHPFKINPCEQSKFYEFTNGFINVNNDDKINIDDDELREDDENDDELKENNENDKKFKKILIDIDEDESDE